jgi:hypothetical protein
MCIECGGQSCTSSSGYFVPNEQDGARLEDFISDEVVERDAGTLSVENWTDKTRDVGTPPHICTLNNFTALN